VSWLSPAALGGLGAAAPAPAPSAASAAAAAAAAQAAEQRRIAEAQQAAWQLQQLQAQQAAEEQKAKTIAALSSVLDRMRANRGLPPLSSPLPSKSKDPPPPPPPTLFEQLSKFALPVAAIYVGVRVLGKKGRKA
jgi:hypothetical protein